MEVDGSDDFPDFNWAIFRFHVNFQGCTTSMSLHKFALGVNFEVGVEVLRRTCFSYPNTNFLLTHDC